MVAVEEVAAEEVAVEEAEEVAVEVAAVVEVVVEEEGEVVAVACVGRILVKTVAIVKRKVEEADMTVTAPRDLLAFNVNKVRV